MSSQCLIWCPNHCLLIHILNFKSKEIDWFYLLLGPGLTEAFTEINRLDIILALIILMSD